MPKFTLDSPTLERVHPGANPIHRHVHIRGSDCLLFEGTLGSAILDCVLHKGCVPVLTRFALQVSGLIGWLVSLTPMKLRWALNVITCHEPY